MMEGVKGRWRVYRYAWCGGEGGCGGCLHGHYWSGITDFQDILSFFLGTGYEERVSTHYSF